MINVNEAEELSKAEGKVEVRTLTWNRDSHGLFDYQSKDVVSKRMIADRSVRVVRCSTQNVSLVPIEGLTESQFVCGQPLVCIRREEKDAHAYSITVDSASQETQQLEAEVAERPCLVVRGLLTEDGEQRGYPLKLGDVIRLGKRELVVAQMRLGNFLFQAPESERCREEAYVVSEAPGTLTGACRICMEEEWQPENFLVSLCHCKGSCREVHLLCLKKWLQSKIMAMSSELVTTYNFTKFECEICKARFPRRIMRRGALHDLFVVNLPDSPYIMLESINADAREKNLVFLVQAPSPIDQVKIGRGNNCEVCIGDISVSREHSYLKYDGRHFLLFDHISKFGTLIQVRSSIAVTTDRITIQCGRTLVVVRLLEDQEDTLSRRRRRRKHRVAECD